MINVMVVEDQAMPRQLFEIFINESENYNLLYSIESAAMAEIYCMSGKVDLILMDICTAMGESGIKAAERIKKRYPLIKIIIVTSMPECSFLNRARQAGVDSFWYKEISKEPIIELMDRTMSGEYIFPDNPPVIEIGQTDSRNLTMRELDVLRELTSGAPDAEIAEHLNMSVWTVRSHVRHMLEKTGFESRTRLAVVARESGLVILGY